VGRISKRGGKRGKLAFPFSTLSTARHFHSAKEKMLGFFRTTGSK
jgi:hypothetical protein